MSSAAAGPAREGRPELLATALRVRQHIVRMVASAASGHPGGSLSAVEILVALYGSHLRHDPRRPAWPDRDRLLLSKGHATPAFYAVLAEAGYFPVGELATFRRYGGRLEGHPSLEAGLPGVEISGGSLGHGLALGVGMALAARLDGSDRGTYVLLGDGELQEGEVWEAAMAAAHYRLRHLVAIVDANGVQQNGRVDEVMGIEPLLEKWRSFGWNAREIDGHDLDAVLAALRWASASEGAPCVVIARTVKGKGVSFMEGRAEWHGKAPSGELLEQALRELADPAGAPS